MLSKQSMLGLALAVAVAASGCVGPFAQHAAGGGKTADRSGLHSERAGGSVVRGLALIGLMVALAAAGVGTAGSSRTAGWCGSDESAVDRLPDAVSAQQIT